MKCSNCGQEMKKGKLSFMTIQGLGQMMLSFTSEEDEKKGFFKRKAKDRIILSGEETEAYLCTCCNGIMTYLGLE